MEELWVMLAKIFAWTLFYFRRKGNSYIRVHSYHFCGP